MKSTIQEFLCLLSFVSLVVWFPLLPLRKWYLQHQGKKVTIYYHTGEVKDTHQSNQVWEDYKYAWIVNWRYFKEA